MLWVFCVQFGFLQPVNGPKVCVPQAAFYTQEKCEAYRTNSGLGDDAGYGCTPVPSIDK